MPESLEKQLARINKNLNNKNVNLGSGKSVRDLLQKEGMRLYQLIQDEIDSYYLSYDPLIYERSYQFQNSLRIEPVSQVGNELSIRIYFDSNLAEHDSIMGGESGYVPILLNDGWEWDQQPSPPIEHFSRYSGFHFIEKAIERYNQTNPYNFKIKVHKEHNGETIEDINY